MSTGDGARDEERPVLATPWGAYRKWTMALAGLAVVFVVLVGYDLISGGVLTGAPASPATSPKATASSTRPTASASSSPTASSSSSAMADRSGGNADRGERDGVRTRWDIGRRQPGDGVSGAPRRRGVGQLVVATAEFGHMQSGTGILLDMGHAVTVNSVGLVLGSAAGADVQVRVGDAADLDSMSTAASMPDAHGTLHLPLNSPASARYVLIWFTRLPVKSPGKYQVSLYRATVDGHA